MTHFHWRFRAFDNGVVNPVEISVADYDDEPSALYAAQKLVKRQNYELIQVFQCFTCKYQESYIKAASGLMGWFRKNA